MNKSTILSEKDYTKYTETVDLEFFINSKKAM